MTEDELVGCITNLMDMSLSKLQEIVKDKEGWWAAVYGTAKSRTRLNNYIVATTVKVRHAEEFNCQLKKIHNMRVVS